MTYASDPPRLRALARKLPSELALALESVPDEEISLPELERLALDVRTRAARAPSAKATNPRVPTRWQRALVSHGALGLVIMFALGATAGVLVTTTVFLGLHLSSPRAAPPTASPARPAQNPQPREKLARAPVPAAPASVSAPMIESALPRTPSPTPMRSVATTSASSPSPAPGSAAEFSLVSRAQASLATDPRAALALVNAHERQFPNGTLVEECETIAIEALLRLGRHADAESRARRFNERFPASLQRRRLDILLGASAHAPDRRP